MSDPEYEAQFAAIRERFKERLADWRDALAVLRGSAEPDGLREMKRLAHALAGTGGTMGYDEISERAFELEDELDRALAGETAPAAGDRVEALIRALNDALRA